MKKLLLIVFTAVSALLFAQPANDNCTGATSLGTLGAPGACGSGIKKGSVTTLATTNVNATAENPYYYQTNCSSNPAANVWYTFTTPTNGYAATIVVSGATGTLTNPQISLWQGTCAGGFSPMGCASGSAGTTTLTIAGGLIPGTTYYISVSGTDITQMGAFTLKVNAFQDCQHCLNAAHITASPLPVNGTYQPGQTVSFCYHIDKWTQNNLNYLHGVQMSFGSGWDMSSLTTTAPPTYLSNAANNTNCSGTCGTWAYYASGCTNSSTGVTYGPGFYHNGSYLYNQITGACSCYTSSNPGAVPSSAGGGDGSADAGTGAVITPPANQWNFCWTIKVLNSGCNPGSPLTVTVTVTGDGESGDYSSSNCVGDAPVIFNAVQSCCPPSVATTSSVSCNGATNGVLTATATTGASGAQNPYVFTWSNSSGTIATNTVSAGTTNSLSGLGAGTYTVVVTDKNSCSATSTLSVTQPSALTAALVPTSASCASLGSISNTPGGGTPGYTYAWTGPSGYTSSVQSPTGLNPGVYTLTLTDSKSCSYTATATVGQTGSVSAGISVSPTTQCLSGNSFTFNNSGTSSVTYAWNYGDGSANGSGASVTHSYAAAGTYVVTETVTSGVCTATTAITVTVTANPTLSIPQNTYTTCINSPVVFSVSGAGTYTWSPGTGLSGINSATPTVTPNSSGTLVYNVTGTSGGCNTTPGTVTLTVNALPLVTVNSASTCAGGTVTLTASGATTYSWTGGPSNTPSISVSPASNQSYTVTGTLNSCTASAVGNVSIITNPVISVNSASVCAGGTVTLNASGAGSYTWTPSSTLSSSVGSSVVAAPAGTTTYTVTGSAGSCSAAPATAVVTVVSLPSVSVTASSQTVCSATTVTLTASGANSYTWSAGTSSPNGTTVTVNPSLPTSYTVTGDNGTGCVNSASITININITPTVTATNGSSISVCAGNTLAIGFTTTPTGTVSWTNSNINLGGPQLSSTSGTGDINLYITPLSTTTQVGILTVTGTSGSCSSAPLIYTITINAAPAIDTTNKVVTPASCVNPIGGGISNITITSPAGIVSYTWTNSTPGPSFGTVVGSTATLTGVPDGTYCIGVTDGNGCKDNFCSIVVPFVGEPQAPLLTAGNTITYCQGQTIQTLTVSVVNSGTATPTVNWYTDAAGTTPAPGATANSTTYTPTGTAVGQYTVYAISNVNSCTSTATPIVITITAPPTASASASGTITCITNTVSLSAATSSGSPALTYTWTAPSGGIIVSGTNSVTAIAGGPGTYSLIVTDGAGCISSNTATVTVSTDTTLPTANATESGTITCSNLSAALSGTLSTGTGSSLSYTWTASNGGTIANGVNSANATAGSAGTYSLTVTDLSNGCISQNTATVSVTTNTIQPTVSAVVNGSITCTNSLVTLDGSGSASNTGGTLSYNWSPSSGLSSVTDATVTSSNGGNYILTVTDNNNGCTKSQSVSVPTNTTPPSANAGIDAIIPCAAPATASLTGSSATAGATYSWAGPNSYTASGANATGITQAGIYTLTVTDPLNGCIKTDVASVSNSTVIASFTASPIQGTAPLPVTFTNGSVGATTYTWNFGDGSAPSNTVNPTNTFNNAGTYTVVLVASNSLGCSSTYSATILVEVPFTMVVPNIFSPNGDNINDLFFIPNTGVKTLTCNIFNRWGQEVYTITSPQQGWDGLMPNGQKASEGSYMYILTAQGVDGKDYNYQGTVTLVR